MSAKHWEMMGGTDRHNDVCLIWSAGDGRQVTIYHRDGGVPEVDFESGRQLRSGSLRDALQAVRDCRELMARYCAITGYSGHFACCPDNRDGGGAARSKFFSRFFRELSIEEMVT